jgi:hypothetical protein
MQKVQIIITGVDNNVNEDSLMTENPEHTFQKLTFRSEDTQLSLQNDSNQENTKLPAVQTQGSKSQSWKAKKGKFIF